jgi:hypothetical protein
MNKRYRALCSDRALESTSRPLAPAGAVADLVLVRRATPPSGIACLLLVEDVGALNPKLKRSFG